MALATRNRPSTSAPGDGSRTITLLDSQPEEDQGPMSPDDAPSVGVLRLRAGPRRPRQRVAWGDDVIDNEGCGKKTSKICCIYHKPKRFDESSDESSADDSDSDSSCDDRAQPSQHNHRHRQRRRSDGSPAFGGIGGDLTRNGRGGGVVHQLEDDEPNAYEIVPGGYKGKRKS